jgi:fimbrial chaperone protein
MLSALAYGHQAVAGAFSISPVRVELAAAQRTQALTVRNEQDAPVTVELHVKAWAQHDGEDELTDSRDVLSTPPVFTLQGHAEQIIRVALRRDVDTSQELSYRLILQEVPEQAPQEFIGLRVALRLSLPIFVSPRQPAQDDVAWRATRFENGGLRIEAENRGSAHLQVTDFMAQLGGDDAHAVHAANSKYLLPGSSGAWTLTPAFDVSSHTSITVRGFSDRGEFSTEIPLERK